MLQAALMIAGGLALLVWSADRFVEGAAAVARGLGVPSLLIGMLILGFGTSAPELLVSAMAAANGTPGLALGNAFGSNIANIGLILGVGALVRPMQVESGVLKRELPWLAAITLVAAIWLWDGQVSVWDGVGLLGIFVVWVGWAVIQGLAVRNDKVEQEVEHEEEEKALAGKQMSSRRGVVWLVVGLLVLTGSSRLLVSGAVDMAKIFGVSDMLIGLTIVAVGTSLPELAATVASSLKGEADLALGNVIGSNMFNTLVVVGVAGVICPINVAAASFRVDLGVTLGFTLALFLLAYGVRRRRRICRSEGVVLVLAYVGYMVWLVK